ncbi:MAG: hypothetical protein Q9188_007077 [Gyalolechia gomerana]
MEQETSSPATLTVQGFTPINQCFDSATPSETITTTAQGGSGANNGKKRQRKASTQASTTRDPAKRSHSRPPKKAKQRSSSKDQDISNVFNVKKPHTQGNLGHCEPRKDSSPGIAKETEVRGLDAYALEPLEGLEDPFSPGTYQAVESPLTTGLGSVYQAAFEPEERRSIADEPSDLEFSNILPSMDTDGENSLSAGEFISPSAGVEAMQPTPGENMSISKTSASELDGIPTQTVTGSVCQVPCSSGILLGEQHTEAIDAEPAALIAPLPSLEQCLADCYPHDWDMVDSGEPHPHEKLEDHCGEPSPPRLDNCDVDVPDFEDLLLAATKDKCSSTHMDQDEIELSMLMSEFINSQGEVLGDSSEVFAAPPELSFPSDIDFFESFDENDINNVSSDTSFVESSSPCIPSRLDVQKDSKQYDVSTKPVASNQTFTSEDTYDDDDLEAVFAEVQSSPSVQVPRPSPPSPATSPLNQPGPSSPILKPKKELSSSKDVLQKISFDQTGTPIPFIRSPFPNPIRDRSPVIGLGTRTLLRTCFRIGEALNAGSLALRTKQDTVIELYARVVYSERPPQSVKQRFQFSDIFSPDKPPFLKGTYGLWKGVELWDLDSKIFLGEKGKGKMARVVGRMGREEKSKGLEMTVLSIWEAGWEDVGVVKGIVCR